MKSSTTARAFRTASLFALTLLASTAASAAGPRWVRVTPFGGSIVAMAQAPSAPETIYAAGGPGLVFRSTDGGATWRPRSGGEQDALIEDLIADPFDAQTVYARTGQPFLRTRDGGLHWSEIVLPFPATPISFAVDSRHPGVLFAGTYFGLYRSGDRGDTWSLAALEDVLVEAVAADPREDTTLFAVARLESTQPPQIWKSTDDGATWTAAPLPAGNHSGPPRFVFDPARPGTLYLFFVSGNVGNSVLRSTDGGASWSDLVRSGVRDLAAAPDGVLYAATDRGVLRSTDGGATWVPPLPRFSSVAPPNDDIARILVSPSAPGALLAAGAIGIWKSADGGESWASSNRGIRAQGSYSVVVAPGEPSTVVTVTGRSIFRSTDRGASWIRAHSFLDGPQPYAILAVDPRRPQTIYGFDFAVDGLTGVPVKTTNGGFDWIRRRFPYSCANSGSICDVSMIALALDPHDADTVLVAGSYFFHLVGQGRFLLRSDDGLKSWTELASPPGLTALVVDPERRDTYYALACSGFFRSRDAGTTWQEVGRGLPTILCRGGEPKALALAPRDSQRIYVGTIDRGIFVSVDGGDTFRAMSRGLETARIATILIDPVDPTRLYAGVPLRGVFQWKADRQTWVPLNRGLPLEFFDGALALDPQHPATLYAASPVYGLFRLDLDDTEP